MEETTLLVFIDSKRDLVIDSKRDLGRGKRGRGEYTLASAGIQEEQVAKHGSPKIYIEVKKHASASIALGGSKIIIAVQREKTCV
jgi:hypothetical protein